MILDKSLLIFTISENFSIYYLTMHCIDSIPVSNIYVVCFEFCFTNFATCPYLDKQYEREKSRAGLYHVI